MPLVKRFYINIKLGICLVMFTFELPLPTLYHSNIPNQTIYPHMAPGFYLLHIPWISNFPNRACHHHLLVLLHV